MVDLGLQGLGPTELSALPQRQKKRRRKEKNPPGGDDNVLSPQKNVFRMNENPKTGTRNKNSWEGTHPKMKKKPSFPRDRSPSWGASKVILRGATFITLRSQRWAAAPLLSPRTPRAAVQGGRDAVARPREFGWRSGESAPRGAYEKTEVVDHPKRHGDNDHRSVLNNARGRFRLL